MLSYNCAVAKLSTPKKTLVRRRIDIFLDRAAGLVTIASGMHAPSWVVPGELQAALAASIECPKWREALDKELAGPKFRQVPPGGGGGTLERHMWPNQGRCFGLAHTGSARKTRPIGSLTGHIYANDGLKIFPSPSPRMCVS